jgi:large subunit ribosomal protein L25
MAERVTIEAESRDLLGKKAKRLRREGLIPAVVYGQRDPLHIQVEMLPLRRALRQAGYNELIDIDVEDEKVTVLAREIQQHPTRGDLIHVDFYEVDMQETIITEVSLNMQGSPDAELQTLGQVTQILHNIEVECLPGDLISEIEFDISHLENPDDVVYAHELDLPDGVRLMTDPEAAVTSFDYFREEEEEEEEEELLFAPAADEVEVIGKGKAEEEEEEFEEEEVIDL